MTLLVGALSLALSTGLWLYFILQKDKVEREPLLTVILIGFAGGLLSIIFSGVSSGIFSALTGIRPTRGPLPVPRAAVFSLFIGFNEEFFKCLAAMLLIRKMKEFDEPADGIIYAMAVSLGFAAIENIAYMARSGVAVILPRTLLAVPGHLGFGALWGTGFAMARFRYRDRSMFRVVLPYMAAAALFHALYDFWLFAFLPMRVVIAPLIVFSLWWYASRKTKFLVAHSPFLPLGQCPECGARNRVSSGKCVRCGATMYTDRVV
jgi:protease PrsW